MRMRRIATAFLLLTVLGPRRPAVWDENRAA